MPWPLWFGRKCKLNKIPPLTLAGGTESACLPAQEPQIQPPGREDPLEEEMATHCSALDWEIPWPEKPGELGSIRLTRVGHD